jgi:hypothetical protein
MTNGTSLYFTQSNVVIWFCEGANTVFEIDPKTHKPLSILLETPPLGDQPGQEVFDINADGIPDTRKLMDGSNTRQVFCRGEWYTRTKEGKNNFIIIDGNKQRVHFNGKHWVEVSTNSDSRTMEGLFSNRF